MRFNEDEMVGWMASPTQWIWIWPNSGRWQRTGKPGVLQSMGSQRVGHDWVTEQHHLTLPFKQGYQAPCWVGVWSSMLLLLRPEAEVLQHSSSGPTPWFPVLSLLPKNGLPGLGGHSVSSVAQCVRLFVTPWTAAHQALGDIRGQYNQKRNNNVACKTPEDLLICF